jgi:hypothetical protein
MVETIAQDSVLGGGAIAASGAGLTYLGAGDFNGDGKADLLFENASGVYSTWDLSGSAVIGGGAIGSPGANMVFEGIADLNGNHISSILFYDISTGGYVSWEMNDTSVNAVHALGTTATGWTFQAVS